ncbi:MAG: YbaB/EbfC family nucleoid-associated protein [Pseudomonadota bacterium]|nr:YbaB/EbfC family nucleoid-associated protein [Pseudomonadota bacterium]
MSSPFDKLFKQAQQMGQDMQQAAKDLYNLEVTGEAAGGLVEVVINARREVRRVQIDDSVMDDKSMLEDLIAAAFNDAVHKADKMLSQKVGGMARGFGGPSGS